MLPDVRLNLRVPDDIEPRHVFILYNTTLTINDEITEAVDARSPPIFPPLFTDGGGMNGGAFVEWGSSPPMTRGSLTIEHNPGRNGRELIAM